MRRTLHGVVGVLACAGIQIGGVALVGIAPAGAAPPEPAGPHPRLFLDDTTIAALRAAASVEGSAVSRAITRCMRIHANPGQYAMSGFQGLDFANNFGACAIAYIATDDATHLSEAIRYFRVLLNDRATVGDGAGGDTVVHGDRGYAMRAYAPYAALAYDWLHDAPGVDNALRTLARQRFKAWTDYYDTEGYHNNQPGANYHAGYIFGDTMIAIAQAGEAGAEGAELWTHVVDDLWGRDMAAALADGGALDGGDWLEGWQYGPLATLSYAASARALRENGVALAGYAAWEGELVARAIYASPPDSGQIFIGGDGDIETPYREMSAMNLYAAMIDAGPDEAKGWAQHLIETYDVQETEFLLLTALAQARAPAAAVPFPTSSSTLLWVPGSHTVYARTGWAADNVWFVTRCMPSLSISDHLFFDAGNLVLSRGPDHLIVDPTPYGSMSSLTGNAPTLASASLPDGYQPGQGPWGSADQVGFAWRRQTQSGVIAARCEYHGQYFFREEPGDVTRAVRDMVLVPSNDLKDATLVVIDHATGGDGPLLLRYRSLATLSGSSTASGMVGGSRLTIQLAARGATGSVRALPEGDCFSGQPRGDCDAARFAGGEWRTSVADSGGQKRAITIVDASSGAPAAASVSAGTGHEVVGAERGGRWIAVVTTTTPSGTTATTPLTYRTPAGLAATHVVVDAPRGSGGRSDVTASQVGNDCEVTVSPRDGSDGGYDGRPLTLLLTATCAVSEDPNLGPFGPPTGIDPDPNDPGHASDGGGCCDAGASPASALALAALVAPLLGRRRRRRLI